MLTKKSLCIGVLILGIILIGVSFCFKGEELKTVSGLLIGMVQDF